MWEGEADGQGLSSLSTRRACRCGNDGAEAQAEHQIE